MRLIACLLAACALCAGLSAPAAAQNRARSEVLDMEEKDRALVAREGVKQRRETRNAQRSGDGSKAGSDGKCGQVDIGNESDNKGSSRIAERQKTVIVTGNIINSANCR